MTDSASQVLISFAAAVWGRHATLPPPGEGALRDDQKTTAAKETTQSTRLNTGSCHVSRYENTSRCLATSSTIIAGLVRRRYSFPMIYFVQNRTVKRIEFCRLWTVSTFLPRLSSKKCDKARGKRHAPQVYVSEITSCLKQYCIHLCVAFVIQLRINRSIKLLPAERF